MSWRKVDDDRIMKLLDDTSTPEVSCSEEDPYCDDGEYGSDKDFEPDYNELSSDSDGLQNRRRRANLSVQHSTRHEITGQSDTDVEDEVSDVDTGLLDDYIPAVDRTLIPDYSPAHSQTSLDQTNFTPGLSPTNIQQNIVIAEVHRPEYVEPNKNSTSSQSVEKSLQLPTLIHVLGSSVDIQYEKTTSDNQPAENPRISSNHDEITTIAAEVFDEPQLSSKQTCLQESEAALPATRRGVSPILLSDDIWHETTEPIPVFDFDYLSAGLRVGIDENLSELDMFKLMFSDELLEYLVSQTNSYGLNLTFTERPHTRNSRKQVFRHVDKEEMLAFLGLCLLQGQCSIPNTRSLFSYSNALYYHPYFSYTMSQRRFAQILRCVYIGEIGAQREKKVVDFIEALCNNFRRVYGPNKELSLDESLVLFRGRLDFRQYIKNKKARYGIKFYELTSSDGFVLNIIMYSGKEEDTDVTTKKTEKIVMKLLNPYLMKGHHVYMDNFYNDVELSQKLLRLRTHTCGTLRKSRVSNPKVLTNAKLKKGEHLWRRKGIVYVSVWKDKRPVYVITTINHPKLQWVSNRFGKYSNKPKEVAKYNQFMGGIDRKDQMVSYYSSPQKTIRWYKKVFFHMFDVTTWNAFYIYKKYFKPDGRYEFLDFRDALIKQMTKVDKKLSGRDLVRLGSIYASRKTNTAQPETSAESQVISGGHWPELIPCSAGAKRKFKFLNCKLCTKKKVRRETRYRCKGCESNTPLCPDCFEEWHAIEDAKDN